MKIPEGVGVMLGKKPLFAVGGTRDASLLPSLHFCYGVRLDPDRRWVDAFVVAVKGEELRANLADNGRFALTVGHQPTHETYQLKGRGEIIDTDDAAKAFRATFSEEQVAAVRAMPYPPPGLDAAFHGIGQLPATLVRLHVEQVFDQTPGPKAGNRVEG